MTSTSIVQGVITGLLFLLWYCIHYEDDPLLEKRIANIKRQLLIDRYKWLVKHKSECAARLYDTYIESGDKRPRDVLAQLNVELARLADDKATEELKRFEAKYGQECSHYSRT